MATIRDELAFYDENDKMTFKCSIVATPSKVKIKWSPKPPYDAEMLANIKQHIDLWLIHNANAAYR